MVCSNDDTTGLSGFCARMAQRGGPQADTEEDAVAMAIATDTAEDRILRQAVEMRILTGEVVARCAEQAS